MNAVGGAVSLLATDRLAARRRGILLGLGTCAVLAALIALGTGAVAISPLQVIAILLAQFGIDAGVLVVPQQDAVLMSVRLPRVLLSLAVGAVLGIGGAALQALFRNPLADPGLVGVSGGAACGAVAWIVVGGMAANWSLGAWGLPLAAFVGGFAAALGVYAVARSEGRVDVAMLLLAGLAMNALTGAILGYLIYLGDEQQVRALTFWLLGSLGGATWGTILPALVFIAVALVSLAPLARAFDALALGEAEAGHLGVPVEGLKRWTVAGVTLGVGAATALTGIIGFVGLMAPHLVRLIGGPAHRFVLPASALLGAALVTLADTGARMAVVPAELPIGVVTSAIGAPFFFWLLRARMRDRGWR